MIRNNLAGKRFGCLTVINFAFMRNRQSYWLCVCDCGKGIVTKGARLKAGHTKSCGCQKGHISHKESKTRLYRIWVGMRDRCGNANNPQYNRYGSRGIEVCAEWHNYITFRDWALSNGYADDLTIDRIDNDGNYCPENCRWATAKEQANNTRKTRFITYNGQTHSVSEWARILGIKQSTISMRINKYGWSVENALGKEVKKHGS